MIIEQLTADSASWPAYVDHLKQMGDSPLARDVPPVRVGAASAATERMARIEAVNARRAVMMLPFCNRSNFVVSPQCNINAPAAALWWTCDIVNPTAGIRRMV